MRYWVTVSRASEDFDLDGPGPQTAGYIYAENRDHALDKIMKMYHLVEENIDETEQGGWGGRPDDYLLAVIYKPLDKYWGCIDITDGDTWPTSVINDPSLKARLQKPFRKGRSVARSDYGD